MLELSGNGTGQYRCKPHDFRRAVCLHLWFIQICTPLKIGAPHVKKREDIQVVVQDVVVANATCFQQHASGSVPCHCLYSSGLEAAAACLHHVLCMPMYTSYIAEFDRHSHLVTMLPMISVAL